MKIATRFITLAFLALFGAQPLLAQPTPAPGVSRSGVVANNDIVLWLSNTQIKSGGPFSSIAVACSQLPAFTGDVTKPLASCVQTIATVNANVGVFGTATQVAQVTLNAKGQVTAGVDVLITPAFTSITGSLACSQTPALTGNVTTAAGSCATLTAAFSGDLTTPANSFVTTLATVNANVGTFGSATQVAQVTLNAKGLATAASNVTVTPAASSITGGAALTKADDTNVTLTLGGAPTTALLSASSITAGWTGTLAIARGGTAAATAVAAANNLATCYNLAASAVQVAHTGTTSETTLATITVPAGAMGANGWLEINTIWTYTNSANVKTWRVRFGGAAGTIWQSVAATTTATVMNFAKIHNRNSAASQVGTAVGAVWNATTATPVTDTLNTAIAQDIVISGQLATAAETIAIEAYNVKVCNRT